MAGCFLVYLVLLPLVIETLVPTTSQPIDRTFFVGICIVSVAEIAIGLTIRNRKLPAREEIALQEDASRAVGKWLTVQVVSYTIATSVALYGVVLRFLGAPLTKIVPFYAVALLLVLFWWPRKT